MSQLVYQAEAPAPVLTLPDPSHAPALNPAAQRVLAEIELWCPVFARGELVADRAGWALHRGERFAVTVGEVRAAGRGGPPATGALLATDRRAVVVGEDARHAREWSLTGLAAIDALGNWGGVALVHDGGDTELVVSARRELPSWHDATGWLKVEAAFAAGLGRLDDWLAGLPHRLAVAGDP